MCPKNDVYFPSSNPFSIHNINDKRCFVHMLTLRTLPMPKTKTSMFAQQITKKNYTKNDWKPFEYIIFYEIRIMPKFNTTITQIPAKVVLRLFARNASRTCRSTANRRAVSSAASSRPSSTGSATDATTVTGSTDLRSLVNNASKSALLTRLVFFEPHCSRIKQNMLLFVLFN